MIIFMKPTGNLIRGHVLDCSVGPLVERLRDLDPRLYVRWNPKKLRGWGCWEIRYRPEFKTVRYSDPGITLPGGKQVEPVQGDVFEFEGYTIAYPKYHETNLENHIMDVPYLNYNVLTRLKAMDMWANSDRGRNFLDQADSKAASIAEREKEKAVAERKYELKQQSSMIRDLMDYTLSGGDPSQIANHWGK